MMMSSEWLRLTHRMKPREKELRLKCRQDRS